MKLKVYSVFDVKAAIYTNPMFFRRREEAERAFAISANNPDSDFFKYAEDYFLFELGEYDQDTGIVTSYAAPISVVSALAASTKHKDHYGSMNMSSVA